MGKALDLIGGYVIAPGGAATPLVMSAGDSLVVRNSSEASKNKLLTAWSRVQAVGILRIMSPFMHDRINGIRASVMIADEDPLIPWGAPQPLIKGDTLTADLQTASGAGVKELACILNYYEDLLGADQHIVNFADIKDKIKNIVTMRSVVVAAGVVGWSGAMALNATEDRFKADVDYAILGYMTNVACCAVRYRGPDTSNLGVGGHGCPARRYATVSWFKDLAEKFNLPLIPVINANNKAITFIEVLQDQANAAVTVDTIYAELGK